MTLSAINFKGGLEFYTEPSPLHKTGKEHSNSSLASCGISHFSALGFALAGQGRMGSEDPLGFWSMELRI